MCFCSQYTHIYTNSQIFQCFFYFCYFVSFLLCLSSFWYLTQALCVYIYFFEIILMLLKFKIRYNCSEYMLCCDHFEKYHPLHPCLLLLTHSCSWALNFSASKLCIIFHGKIQLHITNLCIFVVAICQALLDLGLHQWSLWL